MKETKFKQTEIGLIPEDWEILSLGDIMNIKSGDTITGDSFIIGGKYPVFGGNGIRGQVNKFNLEGDYILIGRVGALCGNIHNTKGKCFVSEHALICYPKRNYNIIFISSILKKMSLGQYSGASAQPVLASSKLCQLSIPYPFGEEQERIGEALSEVDDLIDGLKKLVEKKKGIKEAAMTHLLSGKRRIPGFNKPWETKIMEEVGLLIPNNSLAWEFLTNNGIIANIHYGDILTRFGSVLNVQRTQLPYIVSSHEKKFYKSKKIQNGDIIFADTAEDDTVGKAIEIQNVKDLDIVSGLHTIWFRPLKYFSPGFLGYLLNDNSFHRQIPPLATGTKVSSISKPNLLRLSLHYPTDLEEQAAIAKVLTDMDKEIDALERKVKKYESIKKGMMNQLLTGKIRLI